MTTRTLSTLSACFLALGSFFLSAEAADWPSWRGPARDDHSPDTGLLKKWPKGGPKLLWESKVGGKGYSGPVLVGGKIYFTGSRNGTAKIICLEAKNGKELWNVDLGQDPEKGYNSGWGGGPRGSATVSEGLVYAISANGDLVAVSAEDGAKKWQKNLVEDFGGKIPGWGYSECPLVDGDKLVVTPGGKGGAIVALDKKSGKILWRSKGLKDKAQYSSVIVAEVNGKRQYVQLFMKKLAGVDAESGKLLWSSEWPSGRTAVIPTPIYHEGHVYMTSGYGAGCKLVKIDGMLYCLDEAEGSVFLVEASPKGFKERGRFSLPEVTTLREGTKGKVWTHPVVIGGRLYLRDQDLFFCFDVKG